MTRGYVGDTQFAVLPTVEAIHTMIITVVIQLVSIFLLGLPSEDDQISNF